MKLPISVVMTSSVPDRTLRMPGQSAHSAAADDAGEEGERDDQRRRRAVHAVDDEGRGDGAHVELALRADVEIAAAEGDGDAGRGDEQGQRPAQAVLRRRPG